MIFVTGGTGFLGRNLLPYLAQQGHPVRVMVRNPAQHPWLKTIPNLEVIPGDLADGASLAAAMQGCTNVIHAAGLFRMWGDPVDFAKININGTRSMAEAALKAGIQRFVHVSTIVVVGNPISGEIIDENYPTQPADAYQRSKLAGEQIIQHYVKEYGLPAVILRPGAFYGPHGRYAFNRLFFEDPLKGLLIKVDHGRRIIFPVYIDDVAQALHNALTLGNIGEIYNICGDPLTHNEANDIVSQEAQITPFRINAPTWGMLTLAHLWTWLSKFTGVEPYYPINLRIYVFNDWQTSSEKARDELHFRPTPFKVGARRTLVWYGQQNFHWVRKSVRGLRDPAET